MLVVTTAALVSGQVSTDPQRLDARHLIDTGKFELAEEVARQAVGRLLAEGLGDSAEAERANDTLVAALIANGRAPLDDTVALALATLQARETRIGSDDVRLLTPLLNAGEVLVAAARYDEAIRVLARAVAAAELDDGADSLTAATALDQLGSGLAQASRYPEAVRVLERSLAIKERRLNPDDVSIARTLEHLGFAWQRRGDYQQSGRPLRRARVIQAAVDPRHPAFVRTLSLLADQFWFEGDFTSSRRESEQALDLAEAVLRPDHPMVAAVARDLAATLSDLGDFEASLRLRRQALGIAERSFGVAHPLTAEFLHGLALDELRSGDYPSARRDIVQALEAFEARYGAWHEHVATALTVLAMVDARLGDYPSARASQARAVEIHSRVGGPNHPFVAAALSEVAAVYSEEGRPAEAVALLQRALVIREKNLGPDHRDVARTLADLAAAQASIGGVSRAQTLASRALGILEKLDTPDAPEFATVLALYAELQARRGDDAAARAYFERALAIRAKVFGESNPLYAEAQVGLAATLVQLGDPAAPQTAARAEATGRSHLRLMLRSLSERQALRYAAARPRGLNLLLSLADTTPAAVAPSVDGVIRSRALVLDEIAARHGAGRATDTAARSTLTSAQQRLANLLVRGPGTMSPAQYNALVDTARTESETAERALAAQSDSFRSELSRAQIGAQQVLASLPSDSALVSYVRYERTAITRTSGSSATGSAARIRRRPGTFLHRADPSTRRCTSRGAPGISAGGRRLGGPVACRCRCGGDGRIPGVAGRVARIRPDPPPAHLGSRGRRSSRCPPRLRRP